MKKIFDDIAWVVTVTLICVSLFFAVLLTIITVKGIFHKPSAASTAFECSSDCKQMPDLSIQCECHPVKK